MLIFVGQGNLRATQSPEEQQAQMAKWLSWIDDLKKKETYLDGKPLVPGGKMVKGKSPVVTDGPFTESKEIVGGYFIVRAASIQDAAEIAKGCPDLALNGRVEVREVAKM